MGAWIEILFIIRKIVQKSVAPLVGAWIEILPRGTDQHCHLVAPLVGAWIEIVSSSISVSGMPSLPLWERGLKSLFAVVSGLDTFVAPLVGAWIEIPSLILTLLFVIVAPLVGAWIEISLSSLSFCTRSSLPLWERGLKFLYMMYYILCYHVAPLVGAWIEMRFYRKTRRTFSRRSPCGSVD